jgi:hypothetical protein
MSRLLELDWTDFVNPVNVNWTIAKCLAVLILNIPDFQHNTVWFNIIGHELPVLRITFQ